MQELKEMIDKFGNLKDDGMYDIPDDQQNEEVKESN